MGSRCGIGSPRLAPRFALELAEILFPKELVRQDDYIGVMLGNRSGSPRRAFQIRAEDMGNRFSFERLGKGLGLCYAVDSESEASKRG